MDEKVKISEFNEASFKMMRIHELQMRLNMYNTNLFSMNPAHNKFNYQLAISACDSLFKEARPKLKLDDQKKGDLLMVAVKELIEKNPPISYNGKKSITVSNFPNQKLTQKILDYYEKVVRDCIEITGLSTPTKESEGGWD